MTFRITLLLFILAISGPVSAEPEDLGAALERIIQVYGGEENVRKLDNVVQEWSVVALMGNRHGTDTRSVQVPGRLKVELIYAHKQETRVLKDDTGYVIFRDGIPTIAKDMQRDAMRLQLMRLYSPLALRDRIDNLSMAEQEGFLYLTLRENGLRADYVVNMENWRIEKVVGTMSINGNEMNFLTEYSEFKLVDGVLVHHRENKYAGQVNTAVLNLNTITIEAQFEDDTFSPGISEDSADGEGADPLIAT